MELYGENEHLDMNLTPSDRSSNFTSNDIENLKKLINKYAKVILNKKTNGLSIKQKKETWESIAKEFNASSSTYRSVKQLRSKWEYLKKIARKKVRKVNRLRRQTGGGPPPAPLSNTNEWVASMLKESASGLDSQYDGDSCNIFVEPPPATAVYATSNVVDGSTGVVEMQDVATINVLDETAGVKGCSAYSRQAEQPFMPVSSKNKIKKTLNATPHHTRISFLELAEKKKELVELKTKTIESKQESCLIHLKEEKLRLEIELLKKSFENDEKRKQELHELQITKMKLEIEILSNKGK